MARITLILSVITAVVALLGGFRWAVNEWRLWRLRRRSLLLVLLVCLVPAHVGAVDYYLDPDWTGTQSGTQAQPFNAFNGTLWSAVNGSLASQDVTIYMSARDAGTDTDDVLAATVQVTSKTANPTGTLTINGRSFYNTNDTTPSWTAQTGTGRARVTGFITQNGAHVKYNKWTVDGVHVLNGGGDKSISICGDNVTIINSDVEQSSGSTLSPNLLIVPTGGAPEGSSSWCPLSTNIQILNSHIHHSRGESLYVGGAQCSGSTDALTRALDPSRCDGFPSHDNILISGNTFDNCGIWENEGDCIDMKAALTNVTIRGNDITSSGAFGNDAARAIVTQGIETGGADQNIVIERNYIHDHAFIDEAAIAIVDSWGTPNGVTIRNNIIDTVSTGAGIHSYTTQSVGVKIYNNTIYNASGLCLSSNSGSTVEVRNNACLSNNGGGAQTSLSGTITQSNNAFSGTWGGTCTNCVSGLTTAAFTNAPGGNFTLTSGSVLKDVGITIGTFSNDYLGNARPFNAVWDIGAYEYGAGGSPPPPPPDTTPPAPPTGVIISRPPTPQNLHLTGVR